MRKFNSEGRQPQIYVLDLQTGPRPPRRAVASHAVRALQLLSPDWVSWQQRLPLASWPPTLHGILDDGCEDAVGQFRWPGLVCDRGRH